MGKLVRMRKTAGAPPEDLRRYEITFTLSTPQHLQGRNEYLATVEHQRARRPGAGVVSREDFDLTAYLIGLDVLTKSRLRDATPPAPPAAGPETASSEPPAAAPETPAEHPTIATPA